MNTSKIKAGYPAFLSGGKLFIAGFLYNPGMPAFSFFNFNHRIRKKEG